MSMAVWREWIQVSCLACVCARVLKRPLPCASHPGRGENDPTGEKSVAKPPEKGVFQKLKDLFWKEEEEETAAKREKMN